MDYQELLFAAYVRELAAAKKKEAEKVFLLDQNPINETAEAQLINDWRVENPISAFFIPALNDIERTAAFIRAAKENGE